jgi:uncharacterized protein YdhG (YjbR/CyaY superfamily)
MGRMIADSIDGYIAGFPPETAEKLGAIREAIREAAPDATEKISWGMPTFHQGGNIAHFAAHARHIGFYPGAEAIEAFQARLAPYKSSKGAVRFPLHEPLPLALVRDMVRHNLERRGKTL